LSTDESGVGIREARTARLINVQHICRLIPPE
jgi:hypothetical protein